MDERVPSALSSALGQEELAPGPQLCSQPEGLG